MVAVPTRRWLQFQTAAAERLALGQTDGAGGGITDALDSLLAATEVQVSAPLLIGGALVLLLAVYLAGSRDVRHFKARRSRARRVRRRAGRARDIASLREPFD